MSNHASNVQAGPLYAFEGPDGVGKSTLANMLRVHLLSRDVPCESFSFPGRDPGTLGKLVYSLHHDPQKVVGGTVTPTAIQALHIAAHIDQIERRIIPALRSGTAVVLDRWHWSTSVYGQEFGADTDTLHALVEAECVCWRDYKPHHIILLDCRVPKRPVPDHDRWIRIKNGYALHAFHETKKGANTLCIDNTNQTPQETLAEIVARISL